MDRIFFLISREAPQKGERPYERVQHIATAFSHLECKSYRPAYRKGHTRQISHIPGTFIERLPLTVMRLR